MIICHILLISIFFVYASMYLESQKSHSNEVKDKIENAIKRLSREANVPEKEVKQKQFVRKQADLKRAMIIKNVDNNRDSIYPLNRYNKKLPTLYTCEQKVEWSEDQ